MTEEKKYRRKVRLINPGLQLKLTLVFLCVAVTCILVQFTLLSGTLTEITENSPQVARVLYSSLWKHLLVTLGLLVPLTLSVGILVTHRVAGPAYRFEQFFKAVSAGKDPGECRTRKGDELDELCEAINDAMEYMRARMGDAKPAAEQNEATAKTVEVKQDAAPEETHEETTEETADAPVT